MKVSLVSDSGRPPQPDFADLSARVYRLCYSLLRHPHEAADAAQESLARAWDARGRRRPEVTWWTWSAGFAVRVCREHQRERARFRLTQSAAEDAGSPDGDAATSAGSAPADRPNLPDEESAALHDAIAKLPPRQREVVALRYLLDQSTEQTASVLGCPTGTVKSNLHKALRALEAHLRQRKTNDASRNR
jgi:RNA polymerase sigma-70 factor (ECF subfamily)